MSKLVAKGDRDCHCLMQFLSATVRQQLLREDPTGARERRVCEGSAQQYAGQGEQALDRQSCAAAIAESRGCSLSLSLSLCLSQFA
ncbi:hypothetical protein L7F22_065016 [Adiantum nelumboides]|nr:hypothetical protein [Adiantum nelumboides]